MHIFSFFVIAYGLYIIFSGKNNRERYVRFLTFALAISLYIQIGLFLEIGSFDITYSFSLEILIGVWSALLIANKFRVSKSNFYKVLFFILVLGINITLLIVHPYTKSMITHNVSTDLYVSGQAAKQMVSFGGRNILAAIKFLIFLPIVLVMRKLELKEKREIIYSLTEIGKFYMGYCTLEFIVKNVFHSGILYEFQNIVFGVATATQTEIRIRGGIYTLQGLTREPSHLALQLVTIILLFHLQERISGKNYKGWILLGLFFMIIGMSLTSFVCAFTLLVFAYLFKQNSAGKVYFMVGIFFACVAVAIVFVAFYDEIISSSYYARRLVSLVYDMSGIFGSDGATSGYIYISNKARMVSIADGLMAWKDNVLFGTGVGTSGCQADFVTNLEELGLVGFTAWLAAVPFGRKIRNEKYKWAVCVCFIPFMFTFAESIFWTLCGIAYFMILEMLFGDYVFSVGNLQHIKKSEG